MSEPTPPPKPDADKLAKELQASLAKRRPTQWKPVLTVLGLATAALTLMAWWLYPTAPLPLMQVLVLDEVCTPGETPHAHVQLYAAENEPPHLAGRNVLFLGPAISTPGGIGARTGEFGRASIALTNDAKEPVLEFYVRHYVESRKLEMTHPKRGRIFVWPRDARLLIVDIDDTLNLKEPNKDALAALKKADADGWHIVYVSTVEAPERIEKIRTWLETQEADADWPAGPQLNRPAYVITDDLHWRKQLADRFAGTKVVVVKAGQSVQGWGPDFQAIAIGDAKTPSWADVAGQLELLKKSVTPDRPE